MKRIIRLAGLVLVMAVLCAALILGAAAQTQLPEQCSHCNKAVTWKPLSEVTATTIPAGHYYVDAATVTVTNKTIAKDTAVCIYMNGNTIEAEGVDRVFSVSGTLTVMGEGTVKGYGRNKSMSATADRYGGTVHIPSSGTFNLYDATITSEKLTDSKASNGGNLCVYGTFNMYSGAVNNGYASNSGGNIFVAPAGTFYMAGGQITGGSTGGVGISVCVQGRAILSGSSSINDLFLWDKSEAGYDTLLTVKGSYTGASYIQLRKGTSKQAPAADMVVGTSDNAKIKGTLNFANSGLFTKISNGQLVLTNEDPTLHNGYCQACGKNTGWTALTDTAAAATSLSAGHYYLDITDSTAEWASKAISGSVCLDLNGQTLTGATRAFTVPKGATLNIQGDGTVSGHGPATSASDRLGGTIQVSSGGFLNLYGGTLTSTHIDGYAGNNGGAVGVSGTFTMYGGQVTGGYASNTGGNVFVGPSGTFKLLGGQVAQSAKGTSVYIQGNLVLGGNGSVDNAYLTYKSGGPELASMVTIQGVYSGSAVLDFNGLTFAEGAVVGINDNADLSHASLVIDGCSFYVVPDGDALKLTASKTPITKESYCSVCQKTVTWTALMEDFAGQGTIKTGHYYLDFASGAAIWSPKLVSGRVCLDLNGMTLTGTNNVFCVETSTIFNLMGEGTVQGRGYKSSLEIADKIGGTVIVENDAVMNQYGGTLTFQPFTGLNAGNGGIVNVAGTYNMYDGVIKDGQSVWVGGNIFVTTTGSLNLYGGTISGGSAKQLGNSVSCRGRVMLTGNATVNELHLYPDTSPVLSEMLTIEGKYTGTVKLRVSGITNGLDVGTAINADISEATITTTSSSVKGLAVHGSELILLGTNNAVLMGGNTLVGAYGDLAAAVEAYSDPSQIIILFADHNEDLTLSKNVCVDLNGYDITGTVSGNGYLFCKDAHTDDFTVADNTYGTVTAGANVKPLTEGQCGSPYSYLMATEDGKVSFHCVKLQVSGMSLRPANAGIYFTCAFAGDEVVKANVKTFGMIVSVSGDPMAEANPAKTVLEAELFGTSTQSTSTMIQGIIKETNTDAVNAQRAEIPIYGRTYVDFGTTVFYGSCTVRSLREQVEGTAAMYGIERMWDALTTTQRRGVMDMYSRYEGVLSAWDLPNIKNAVANRDDAGDDVLAERRAQVVAKMRQMGDIYWRATEDVKYRISSTARWVEFKAGRIYRGMPYAYARSDQYTFLEFAGEPDEKGIYDISGLTTTHLGNGSTYARIGNDCSGSVNFSWSSVGADISGTNSSRYMIEANGYLKVGDYAYTPTEDGRIGISKEIVAANGKERMYEAYAKVQPGDALDTTTAGGGHVILIMYKKVFYNPDGSINPDRSYIHTLEQTPGPVSITVQRHSYNEDLGEVVYDIYIEKDLSFTQAYNSGYLPITVGVLVDPTPVAEANVVDSLDPSEYTYENLFQGELTCSRMISSVTITVTDENGQVFSYTGSGIRASIRKYYMQNFLTEDPAVMRGSLELDKLIPGENYHCTVKVQLASGDIITVRDFDFTANETDISQPGQIIPPIEEEPEDNGEGLPEDEENQG